MLYIEAADAGTAHPSLKTEYLTLFGKYVGTLKGDGYYFVNPFCTAVNPAADTHLNQSGDVDNGAAKSALSLAFSSGRAEVNVPGKKKLSLKIMTLNNNLRAAFTEMADKGKKQIPLRLSAKLYEAIAAWAEDDFRSVNGQIEYLLTECVRQRKKTGKYISENIVDTEEKE